MYNIPYVGMAWDYISSFSDEPLTAIQDALKLIKLITTQLFDDEPTDLSLDPADDAKSEEA